MHALTKALLAALDALSHDQRMKRVAETARELRGQRGLDSLLADLEGGSVYHRTLFIAAASAGLRPQRLLARLQDPSLLVRRRALGAAVRSLEVSTLMGAYAELDPDTAARMRKLARRHARPELVDALLAQHLEQGDLPAVTRLLRGASAEVTEHALTVVDPARVDWKRLAVSRPDFVLDWLDRSMAALAPYARGGLWGRYGLLEALARRRPLGVLDLIERHALPNALPGFEGAASLTRAAPDRVAALLLREGWRAKLRQSGVPRPVLRELRRLPWPAILGLGRALVDAPNALAPLLEALPPGRRAQVFEHARAETDTALRLWPDALLNALPHPLRHAEARRMVGLQAVSSKPELSLRLQAFRAIDEARPLLESAARSARAEDRAQALNLLVICTGRDRRGLDETLERLLRLRNEQDPVRMAAWRGVSWVPPSVFTEAHVEPLTAMVRFTLEARDTSYGTRAAMQALAFKLLKLHAAAPEHPLFGFALETIGALAGESFVIYMPPLHDGLPKGAEHRICEVLLPWLKASGAREFHDNAIRLARALDRRAWHVEPLQALLEAALRSKQYAVARAAAPLWLANPETRDTRVRALLDLDASAITLEPVFRHLHRRRQAWLDPYLEGHVLKGRFCSDKTVYVLPAHDAFFRWLPRQQHKLAALHRQMIGEANRNIAERVRSVQILARMPVHEVEHLKPYLADENTRILEAALGALVWLDVPGPSLETLLQYLEGDRARVAMYAMPRLARLIPRETLLDTLEGLLARRMKVTVHKEALRLLGAHRSARAFTMLVRFWDGGDLHRDVAIAALHAARQWLDEEDAWRMHEEASTAKESLALSLLDPSPYFMHRRHHPRYLGVLLKLAGHKEGRVRRSLFTHLSAHAPGAQGWASADRPALAQLAAARVLDLADFTAWRSAAGALTAVAYEGEPAEHLCRAIQTLLSMAAQEPLAPAKERDQPARQRLIALCERLQTQATGRPMAYEGAALHVGQLLWSHSAFWATGAALHLTHLRWDRPDEVLRRLQAALAARPDPRHPPPNIAAAALGNAWTPAGLDPTLQRLREREEVDLRLCALALLERAGPQATWSAPYRAHLVALRSDPDPLVADRARRVVVFSE